MKTSALLQALHISPLSVARETFTVSVGNSANKKIARFLSLLLITSKEDLPSAETPHILALSIFCPKTARGYSPFSLSAKALLHPFHTTAKKMLQRCLSNQSACLSISITPCAHPVPFLPSSREINSHFLCEMMQESGSRFRPESYCRKSVDRRDFHFS